MPAKIRRVDFSPDEWIAGTLGMTLEEEGLYVRICVLIWSRGERITYELLKGACGSTHGNKINAILRQLEVAGKITRNGSEIGQKRAEKELETARKRVGKWLENGAELSHSKGLKKFSRARADGRAEPSTSKEEGFSPKELNPFSLTASAAPPPPLPSQGDGDGDALLAPTTKAEPDPPTVFDDAALKADAIAAFDRCIDAIRGKLGTLDSQATEPPPPDPRLVEFRAWLQRLNALAGERLDGDARWQAWEILARAEALGDPNAIPPPMLAELAAIESLDAYADAAE